MERSTCVGFDRFGKNQSLHRNDGKFIRLLPRMHKVLLLIGGCLNQLGGILININASRVFLSNSTADCLSFAFVGSFSTLREINVAKIDRLMSLS